MLQKKEAPESRNVLSQEGVLPVLPRSTDEVYPSNRVRAFEGLANSIPKKPQYRGENFYLYCGKAEGLLPQISDNTVDLILTDPPYHSTKKSNIFGDTSFSEDEEYVDWIHQLSIEWKRILRPNGSIYIFCSSEMAPFIYVRLSSTFNMHSIITWTKPNEPGYDGWKQKMKKTSLRRWYPHSERIIFASPALEGNLKRSPFGSFLRLCRNECGLTSNQLTEIIGAYGKVNNGGAVSNWETGRNIPNRAQYEKICSAFIGTGRIAIMPAYEDVIRAFQIDPAMPFTDAWDFMNVRQYKGKHPAEKPQDLLRHIIATSSYPGDVVLDCFLGSGSTIAAALSLGRKGLGIEYDEHWVRYSSNLIRKTGMLVESIGSSPSTRQASLVEKGADVLPLFTD